MMKQWYSRYLAVYDRPFSDDFADVCEEVRCGMEALQSDEPEVTVSVIAHNEERHLLACLWSLSQMKTSRRVEVIGVDNDSTDRTAEIFRRCGVPVHSETRHSCGWARQCGLTAARGKYHLNIDSDTMYPPQYVELMTKALERPGVVAVSSLWSYIPDEGHPWLTLKLYEAGRDLYLWLQHFKRPELSVRGLVFGYHTAPAQREGIRTDIIRGEDGSLALALKREGRIAFLHDRRARAVTGYGTVGSMNQAFALRIRKAFATLFHIFRSQSEYRDEASNLVGGTH